MGLSLVGMVCTAQAGSGDNPVLNETFSFRLGGAYLNGATDVGLDLNGGPIVPDVSLEDIGIDGDEISPYFNARWRFSDSFSAKFEYFGWQDDGFGSVSKDLIFGDITIPAGVAAYGEMEVDIYAVSIGWSFLKGADYEVGVGAGLHVADLSASIEGEGFIGGVSTSSVRETTDVTAPLPNLSLYGAYALSSHWSLEASVGYFSLSYSDYDGELFVAGAAVEYRFNDNFGVGAGYSYMSVDLTVDGDRATEHYDFDLHGPSVYLSAGF